MYASIATHHNEIAALCRRFGVHRLEVFGSAARGEDFDSFSSDVDFLIEFKSDTPARLDSFFGIKAALENLFQRSVDLVESGSVRNPYVQAAIDRHRQTVYAA